MGVRVRVCPGVRLKGQLRCFAPTFGDVVCRGLAQQPAFAPDSSEAAVGVYWSSCILCPEFAPVIFNPI